MKKLFVLAFAVSAAAAFAQTGGLAGSIFYGGDPSGEDGLASERNSSAGTSTTFDDFRIGTATPVNRVYGLFYVFAGTRPVGFDVEIRSGVSRNNGGTLVGGANNLSGTWERFAHFDEFGLEVYRSVIDITPVNLGVGTYHIGIRVVLGGGGRAYVTGTQGSGGIGGPLNNANSFFDSRDFEANFDDTINWGGEDDFSYGVVPEPATMLALAGALGALAARRRRK